MLLCVPDAEIAAPQRRSRPGRWSATAPAPPASSRSRRTRLLAASADDRHRRRSRLHRRRRRDRRRHASGRSRLPGTLAGTTRAWSRSCAAEDRAAYHAAASIASNFLVTLEAAAERLAATPASSARCWCRSCARPSRTGRRWAGAGAHRPGRARRRATVARQREAVAERAPELLALFDALTDATRTLAIRRGPEHRMRTLRTIAELNAALAQPRRERPPDRTGADDGRLP